MTNGHANEDTTHPGVAESLSCSDEEYERAMKRVDDLAKRLKGMLEEREGRRQPL